MLDQDTSTEIPQRGRAIAEARPGAKLQNLTTGRIGYLTSRTMYGTLNVASAPDRLPFAQWEPTNVVVLERIA